MNRAHLLIEHDNKCLQSHPPKGNAYCSQMCQGEYTTKNFKFDNKKLT